MAFDYCRNDLILYGYTGSTAEKYAAANGLTFVAIPSGDSDGDGKVNNVDLANLERYLAEWDGYDEDSLNLDALDLDGDGKVTMRDAIILARHIAGWDGYETIPLA